VRFVHGMRPRYVWESHMNILRTLGLTGAVALGIATFGAASAIAKDYDAPRTQTVKYDEYDLNSEQGAAALYAHLRAASKEVCAPLDGRELRQHAAWKACYKEALSNAVLNVNRDTVTALHQRAMRGDRAS
jgi:UrcA family protein